VAYLLVKVLNGIFDPPPASPSIPWSYLTALVVLIGAVTASIVAGVGRLAARAGPSELRDL
jgi:putative ABC transport system permease protein